MFNILTMSYSQRLVHFFVCIPSRRYSQLLFTTRRIIKFNKSTRKHTWFYMWNFQRLLCTLFRVFRSRLLISFVRFTTLGAYSQVSCRNLPFSFVKVTYNEWREMSEKEHNTRNNNDYLSFAMEGIQITYCTREFIENARKTYKVDGWIRVLWWCWI